MATQHFKRNLLLNLYREEKISLVFFSSCCLRERKMSGICSLFPPFGDPWPSCLLPSHYHFPEPYTLSSHVLLSHSLGLLRCLLHLCHHHQNSHWPAVPEENYLLGWLPDSAFCGTPPRRIRDYHPHCHGLWMLRGHLQASALHDHHATGALLAPGGGGLDWGILHATMQIIFMVNLTFCGPKVIDPLHVWFILTVEICLWWHL